MSKLFAVVVTETIHRQAVVYIRADDKPAALDAATDFAKENRLGSRYERSGYELNAYTGDILEVGGAGINVDVEI